MGSGAAVAKEAGQIILLNDDFGAIVDGIREGRLIFDNLKKCVAYVLSSNVPEIVPFLLFIAMKIPLAIETICILLIDLGTDLAPAVSLAYENPEDAIMQIPPRDEHAHLVGPRMMMVAYGTIGVFQTIAAYFAFLYVFYDAGFTINGDCALINSGSEFRISFSEQTQERQLHFINMCMENSVYQKTGGNCWEDWSDYREEIMKKAQGAYLLTVVWAQIANVLIRKTTVASIFDWYRFTNNRFMLWSILSKYHKHY